VITVDIANNQNGLPLDEDLLRQAVRIVLEGAGVEEARISLAVVDDPIIARLNERFLDHAGPTDVLSFVLEQGPNILEGEVVISAETAKRVAPDYKCSAEEELLLYVIHGTLHLVGYDDATAAQRNRMRRRERAVMKELDLRS
jgi:probable rRNA maturation factor